MNILALSDIHGKTKRVEEILKKVEGEFDLVALLGDLTDFGPKERAVEIMDLIKEYTDTVIGVPGNCDPMGVEEVINEKGVLIDGEVAKINNYEFIGLGGSNPTPFDTPRERSEEEIKEVLENLFTNASNETVLISHAPPKGYLDLASGNHAGSESVKEAIEKYKPSLVLSGHIHEAKGKEKLNESIIVNPGAARDGNYVKINLNNDIKLNFS